MSTASVRVGEQPVVCTICGKEMPHLIFEDHLWNVHPEEYDKRAKKLLAAIFGEDK